jgi:hypothetical protein
MPGKYTERSRERQGIPMKPASVPSLAHLLQRAQKASIIGIYSRSNNYKLDLLRN